MLELSSGGQHLADTTGRYDHSEGFMPCDQILATTLLSAECTGAGATAKDQESKIKCGDFWLTLFNIFLDFGVLYALGRLIDP